MFLHVQQRIIEKVGYTHTLTTEEKQNHPTCRCVVLWMVGESRSAGLEPIPAEIVTQPQEEDNCADVQGESVAFLGFLNKKCKWLFS